MSIAPVSATAIRRWRRPSRRASRATRSDERAMIPNPPVCIRARITSSPNSDHWDSGSTTLSPVTHTAEVAVHHAVPKEELSPGSDAIDRKSGVEGQGGSVRVGLGGRRILKKQNQ